MNPSPGVGVAVEKSLITLKHYPRTFNALRNACNQKTSRDPVMTLDTAAMGKAVQTLIEKGLVERQQAPNPSLPPNTLPRFSLPPDRMAQL
jgi:hypothetical protein